MPRTPAEDGIWHGDSFLVLHRTVGHELITNKVVKSQRGTDLHCTVGDGKTDKEEEKRKDEEKKKGEETVSN